MSVWMELQGASSATNEPPGSSGSGSLGQSADPFIDHGIVVGAAKPVEQWTGTHPSHEMAADDVRPLSLEPLAPVAKLPVRNEPEQTLLTLQQWEGVVTEVLGDEFVVTLMDLTHPEYPEEQAVLPLAEVAPEDRPLLVPGAVLYWSIGYQTIRASGQVQRVSDIRLRRLPAWSRREVREVAQRARQLADLFAADESSERAARTG